ncbi:MAG: hypothetical protein QNL62_22520 [Gammaproteobacteria bacterium]|nr:hypothetical protein [Gammaproteobacteria bacterium]
MTMKLLQKRFLKGTREFEIIDDAIFVRIKSLFKEEKLTVDLSTLDPEPVINGSELAFFSPYKGRPVLSLLLNKPNTEEFNTFIDTLKQKIMGEDNTFASVEAVSPETTRSALARNVYEEPPAFQGSDDTREKSSFEPVNVERLDDDITMLRTYLDEDGFKPLLDSLETLKAEPQNEAAFQKMRDAFNDLGIYQGAVLTYAPYLNVLLSKFVNL